MLTLRRGRWPWSRSRRFELPGGRRAGQRRRGEDAMRVSTSRGVFVSRWLLLGIASGGPAAARGEANGAAEIRLLCFGPSPYTSRHDSMRAGFGIYLLLQQVIRDENLPLKATIYDAFPSVENAERARALLRDARVLVVGTSTWGQIGRAHV